MPKVPTVAEMEKLIAKPPTEAQLRAATSKASSKTKSTTKQSSSSSAAKSAGGCKYGRMANGNCQKAPCKYGPRDGEGRCPKAPPKISTRKTASGKTQTHVHNLTGIELTAGQAREVNKAAKIVSKVTTDALFKTEQGQKAIDTIGTAVASAGAVAGGAKIATVARGGIATATGAGIATVAGAALAAWAGIQAGLWIRDKWDKRVFDKSPEGKAVAAAQSAGKEFQKALNHLRATWKREPTPVEYDILFEKFYRPIKPILDQMKPPSARK